MNDRMSLMIKNGVELINMDIQKIPTLVDPIIPKVGVIALAGASDVGKSTLLLQLCSDIVLHDEFLGFTINAEHRSTIYVSTEDDMFSISNRLQKLKGNDEEKLQKMRFVFSTEELVKTIDEELSKQKADVVTIDTFADIYGGEMNQVNKVRTFMNEYYNLAMRHRCLVVFNHHTGKYTEEKPPNKNNVIGSQGFEGKSRLVLELRLDYGDSNKRHLCIVKGNYLGPEYKERSFELLFEPGTGFLRTGGRTDFNLLAKPKIIKSAVVDKVAEKDLAIQLRKEKNSYRQIEKLLKEKGYNVSRSTLAEWLKPLSVRPNT